jgi:8-oxo-dGTP pyrophosphatase MutT (NUDIX family)
MDQMNWMPHVTVAAIANRDNRFLLVQEKSDEGVVYNQPAGHWEDNETLIDAVIRETLEETAYNFVPEGLVGCYQWTVPENKQTYLRFCFYGHVSGHNDKLPLDKGIIRADWLSLEELVDIQYKKRSPLVLACIDDYLRGKRYSLEILKFISNRQQADIF